MRRRLATACAPNICPFRSWAPWRQRQWRSVRHIHHHSYIGQIMPDAAFAKQIAANEVVIRALIAAKPKLPTFEERVVAAVRDAIRRGDLRV